MRREVVSLVVGRELRVRARTKTFLISTAVLVLVALAAVIAPTFFDDDSDDPLNVAVAGMPATLPAALERAGTEYGRPVRVSEASSQDAPGIVDSGDADVALIAEDDGARVVVREELADGDRGIVMRALADSRVRSALAAAGVSEAEAAEALEPVRITVAAIDPDPVDEEAQWVAVITAIALVLALVFAGTVVATGVAEEKTTRISEVLLAAVRPGELLLGKVLGVGLLALGQMVAVIVPAAVAVVAVGAIEVPDAAPVAIGAGVMWFILGFALYSAAFGALGALVSRQEEVPMAVAPLSYLLWGGYFVVAFGMGAVESTWFRALSFVPPFAPFAMPARMLAGDAAPWEVVVSAVLTLVTAGVVIWLGGRMYRAGLVGTGARIPLWSATVRAVRGR